MKTMKKLLMTILAVALLFASAVPVTAETDSLNGPPGPGPVLSDSIIVTKSAHEHEDGYKVGKESTYFYRLNDGAITVDYVVEVTNPFWYPIYNMTITDSLNGSHTKDIIGPFQTYEWRYEMVFSPGSEPNVTNTASVVAYSLDPDPVDDVAELELGHGKPGDGLPLPIIPDEVYNEVVDNTIYIRDMSLTFTKVIVDGEDEPILDPNFDLFDEVTFLFTVTNTGVTPISHLSFMDKALGFNHFTDLKNFGDIVSVPDGYGKDRTLLPGESYIFRLTENIDWRDLDHSDDSFLTEATNTAYIHAVGEKEVVVMPTSEEILYGPDKDKDKDKTKGVNIELMAEAAYTLNEPGIEIEKSIISQEPDLFDMFYFNGEESYMMTYRLTVTNIGLMDFGEVLVTDEMEQHFDPYGENYEEVIMENLLAGESRFYDYEVIIPADAVGLQENYAQVLAYKTEVPEEEQQRFSSEIEYCPRPWDPLAYDSDELSIYLIDDPAFNIELVKTAGRWEPIEDQAPLSEANVNRIEDISMVSLPSFQFVPAVGDPPIFAEFEWVVYRFDIENTGDTGGFVYLEDEMLFGSHPKFVGWLGAHESRTIYARPISFNRWRNADLLDPEVAEERGLVENEATVALLTYERFLYPELQLNVAAVEDPELCPPFEEGLTVAEDVADELIKVAIPKVSVEKDTDKENYAIGEEVVYNFVVTNEGSTPLETVYFSDYLLSQNEYVIDWTDVGPLDIGESYETSLTSTYDVEGLYFNTAFAWGFKESTDLSEFFYPSEEEEPAPERVMECDGFIMPDAIAMDMHQVAVWEVGILLEKTADDSSYLVGETVTYDFTITNIGVRDLFDVALVDPLLGIDIVLGDLLVEDLEGDPAPLTYSTTTSYDTAGTVINTATAEGWFIVEDELPVIVDDALRGMIAEPEVQPDMESISDEDEVTITIRPIVVNTNTRTTTTTTTIEEEVTPEAAPEPVPVSLVFVVTGQGNISSGSVDFEDAGENYTFGPIEAAPGWEITLIGGPSSADLVMVDENTFFINMDEDKEIHIVFEETLTDVLDDITPEAGEFDIDDEDLPRTGGLPLAIPMALGSLMTGLGLALKKKRY